MLQCQWMTLLCCSNLLLSIVVGGTQIHVQIVCEICFISLYCQWPVDACQHIFGFIFSDRWEYWSKPSPKLYVWPNWLLFVRKKSHIFWKWVLAKFQVNVMGIYHCTILAENILVADMHILKFDITGNMMST